MKGTKYVPGYVPALECNCVRNQSWVGRGVSKDRKRRLGKAPAPDHVDVWDHRMDRVVATRPADGPAVGAAQTSSARTMNGTRDVSGDPGIRRTARGAPELTMRPPQAGRCRGPGCNFGQRLSCLSACLLGLLAPDHFIGKRAVGSRGRAVRPPLPPPGCEAPSDGACSFGRRAPTRPRLRARYRSD